MKRIVVAALAVAVAGAAAIGYWFGQRSAVQPGAAPTERAASATPGTGAGSRRILYYRHPMGLPDTSPTPKKAADGMDYVPVYEGEESQGSLTKITPDRVQKLGVTTEEVARRAITRTLRAVGTVQADERRLRTISPKFEGWVKKLLVSSTGAPIRTGEPLMEVYSPDLITAQQEYAIAWKGLQGVASATPDIRASMQALADGSLQRLRNWDISEPELRRLQAGEPVGQTLLLRSPITGIVIDKMVVEGMRFMPGETLYRLADLSALWVVADVFEQDLGLIRVGQPVSIEVSAYPERRFKGKVAFIYPTLAAETRTARVRIELPNREGLLKPDMFGTVEFAAAGGEAMPIAVANSAVIDSGTRRVVLIEREPGAYEPREVTLGQRGDDYTEVLTGIAEGELVVTSANFLIDAESNLKGALGGFGGHGHGGSGGGSSAPEPGAPVPAGASVPASASPRQKSSGTDSSGMSDSMDMSRPNAPPPDTPPPSTPPRAPGHTGH